MVNDEQITRKGEINTTCGVTGGSVGERDVPARLVNIIDDAKTGYSKYHGL